MLAAAASIGRFIGPLGGAALAAAFGFRFTFAVTGVLLLGLAFVAARVLVARLRGGLRLGRRRSNPPPPQTSARTTRRGCAWSIDGRIVMMFRPRVPTMPISRMSANFRVTAPGSSRSCWREAGGGLAARFW